MSKKQVEDKNNEEFLYEHNKEMSAEVARLESLVAQKNQKTIKKVAVHLAPCVSIETTFCLKKLYCEYT